MCKIPIFKNNAIKTAVQISASLLTVAAITTFCISSAINNNSVYMQYDTTIDSVANRHNIRVDELAANNELIGTPSYYIDQTIGSFEREESSVLEETNSGFEITILDVGQGECCLIKCDGHYLLFDGGDRDTSSFVYSYMQNTEHIKEFDYVIASHYDSDHISGLIGIVKKFPCKSIFGAPYIGDTSTYNSFIEACGKNCGLTYPNVGDVFTLGSSLCQVVSPVGNSYDDENGYSLGIRVLYGSTSFLIMGDATKESELDSLSAGLLAKTNVLVVNHHGSASSTADEFIATVMPDAAVISVGANNEFGHPTTEVLSKLSNIPVYRTDEFGTITFISDGEHIDIYTERTY